MTDNHRHDKNSVSEIRRRTREALEKEKANAAKYDTGKPQIRHVPPAIIESIAKVRMHGNATYGDPENWRTVEWERYFDAMLRHMLKMMRDPMSYDDESGLLHLEHIACNAAFILEMWEGGRK